MGFAKQVKYSKVAAETRSLLSRTDVVQESKRRVVRLALQGDTQHGDTWRTCMQMWHDMLLVLHLSPAPTRFTSFPYHTKSVCCLLACVQSWVCSIFCRIARPSLHARTCASHRCVPTFGSLIA